MKLYMTAAEAVADWQWPNFTPAEMACKGPVDQGGGTLLLVPDFMDRLQALRTKLGFGLTVSSGFRTPAYNASVSHTGDGGPHTTGRAVDLLIRGAQALHLVQVALELGFTGIGVSQKGEARFIHLDDLPNAATSPRPTIWSY